MPAPRPAHTVVDHAHPIQPPGRPRLPAPRPRRGVRRTRRPRALFLRRQHRSRRRGQRHPGNRRPWCRRRRLARIDTAIGAVEVWDPGCETVLSMALAGDALYVGSTTQGTELCGGSAHDYAHKISTSTGTADAAFDPVPNGMIRAVAVSG